MSTATVPLDQQILDLEAKRKDIQRQFNAAQQPGDPRRAQLAVELEKADAELKALHEQERQRQEEGRKWNALNESWHELNRENQRLIAAGEKDRAIVGHVFALLDLLGVKHG